MNTNTKNNDITFFFGEIKKKMEESTKAKELIQKANVVVFYTGAGIGVESGIPTFRGSDGTYTMNLLHRLGVAIVGTKYGWSWCPKFCFRKYKKKFYSAIEKAKPNDAHYAMADLYIDKMKTWGKSTKDIDKPVYVITSNVDGLHRKAFEERGIQRSENGAIISEVHGCADKFLCMNVKCRERHNATTVDNPLCGKCGIGYLRPNVILFGEYARIKMSDRFLFDHLKKEDVLVIIGHSRTVGGHLPKMCIDSKVKVIEINMDPKPKYSDIGASHIHLVPKESTAKLVRYLCSSK
jgi:NAD-dependent deacetylase